MSVAGLCGVFIPVGLERGSGRASRKWCASTGRVEVQQVVAVTPETCRVALQ